MITFRKIMLMQMWCGPTCHVAGVGQCGNLKVRKCANPCVFTVICLHGVAKASVVRRGVRGGCGAGAARVWNAPRLIVGVVFFEIFVCVVILGEARHDYFSQYNADADVVWAHIITGSSHLNSSVTWQAWDNVPV